METVFNRMAINDITRAREAVAEALENAARIAGQHAEHLDGADAAVLLARLQKDIQRFRDDNLGTVIFFDRLRGMARQHWLRRGKNNSD